MWDFGPLVLGSRLLGFHGLASGFEVVGSNPGQPTVVHFLHFAVLGALCAWFCFFRRKQLMGIRPVVHLISPQKKKTVQTQTCISLPHEYPQ